MKPSSTSAAAQFGFSMFNLFFQVMSSIGMMRMMIIIILVPINRLSFIR